MATKEKKCSHPLLASPSWPPVRCCQQDASNLRCPRGGLAGAFPSCISLLGLFLPAQGRNRHQHFLPIRMLLPDHCLGSNYTAPPRTHALSHFHFDPTDRCSFLSILNGSLPYSSVSLAAALTPIQSVPLLARELPPLFSHPLPPWIFCRDQ